MKYIIATSAALALLAGAASANASQMHQRHASFPNGVTAPDTAKVEVSSVYSKKELHRAGLEATDVVKVTVIPTTENLSTRRHES